MLEHAQIQIDRRPPTRGAWRPRALAALVLLAIIAALGAVRVSRAAAAEAGVGIGAATPAQIADARSVGTHWVRMFVSWRGVQPGPGPIPPATLAGYEQQLAGLPTGSKVILDVFGTPQWETGSADEHTPPANPYDYAAFVAALARRLGSRVTAWELWNEEDMGSWWAGGPNPAAYAQLLKASYPAIKAADPGAVVVLGGLTGNDFPFLEGVYQAGGKGYFDAVGVHTDTACNVLSPYDFLRGSDNRMIPDSFLAYREVRATMLANGDDKPIWMTELSWRTTGAVCGEGVFAGQKPQGVSDQTQATYLAQAYHCMAKDPYVQVALWFPLVDEGAIVSGLVRADGSRKPSFAAMQRYVRGGDKLTEPCGVFTGPRIRVARPSNHAAYAGPLPINVSASSSVGVFRITLRIDGRLIRNYDNRANPSILSGRITWQGAKHIPSGWHLLTFTAFDRMRNVSQVSYRIYHRPARPVHHHRRH